MADNEPKPTGEIVLCQTEDGSTRIECRFADENIWLSQPLMLQLANALETIKPIASAVVIPS